MGLPAFDVGGKIAIVTGGGKGLGREFALALAGAGAHVVVAGRTPSALEETAQGIRALGRRALALPTDVTRVASVAEMVERTVSAFGKIDILVNNAGYGIRQMAEEIPEEEWDRTVEVNLKGAFLCGQAVGKQMIRQRGGKIINVSSVLGATTLPGGSAYGTTKAAIVHLTRLWAREWARFGVTVNAIAPSYSKTGMTAPVLDNEKYAGYILSHIPLGRLPTPEELAGPLVFLCSPAADYITGQTLYVDGGWTVA